MLRVLVYDVADPGRLRRVARLIEDHGGRVQFSVFECDLEPPEFELLWERLLCLIKPEEDLLRSYPICADCSGEIQRAGENLAVGERLTCGQLVFIL